MRRLTDSEAAILSELDRLGSNGGLTGNLAPKLFGPAAASARVRRPCQSLARIGLVVRHETNDQRWFITEADRIEAAHAATTCGPDRGEA